MNAIALHTTIPLASLPIPSGPLSGLLAAARDRLCELAADAGVTLHVNTDMHGLLAVNEAAMAAGTWDRILPAADARCRRLDPSNAYWIQGVDSAGETVTVQAGLLYDCRERSIGSRFADLTVSYDDPAAQAPEGERCEVTSEAALALRGRIVWTNAGWTRPGADKRGLFRTSQRANKLVGWLLWQPDAFVSVVEPHIVPVWAEHRMGLRHMDPEPGITYTMIGNGEFPMHFVAFSRVHFFGDLAGLITAMPALAA